MATKRKTSRPARRRVWIKAHCRKRPERRWARELRKSRDMPF